jgi:hypothetical protein
MWREENGADQKVRCAPYPTFRLSRFDFSHLFWRDSFAPSGTLATVKKQKEKQVLHVFDENALAAVHLCTKQS